MDGSKKYFKKFCEGRDKAFIKYVMEDDWNAVLKHLKKYGQVIPPKDKERVAKAGVLKAVQEISSIPVEVKAEAAKKCVLMGFRPTVF